MSSQDDCTSLVRLGLSHVIPELARLCPDPLKQAELLQAHNFGPIPETSRNPGKAVSGIQEGTPWTANKSKSKGKGKQVVGLSDGGGLNGKQSAEVPPLGPGVGERAVPSAKGDSQNGSSFAGRNGGLSQMPVSGMPSTSASTAGWECAVCTLINKLDAVRCEACSSYHSNKSRQEPVEAAEQELEAVEQVKRKKKTSKFNRIRLGDGSAALMLQALDEESGTMVVGRGLFPGK